MTLLFHCYEWLDGRVLHCALTGQRLRLVSEAADVALFEYSDRDTSVSVAVQLKRPSEPFNKTSALVDWNRPEHVRVRADYGLWRRLTWFLLDAMIVWHETRLEHFAGVTVTGAWIDRRWYSDARCESVLILGGTGRDELIEEIAPHEPYPLGSSAPSWRYEPGEGGARKGRIAISGENDRALLADLSLPLEAQLRDVPRFISDQGDIFFFHRVSPHVGPEYAPAMEYGLKVADFAFYFSGRHASLLGKPIQLDPKASSRCATTWEKGYRLLSSEAESPPRPRLHPQLREQLYFALGEVNAMIFALPDAVRPVMADLEFGQEMRFGSELRHISEPPMSVGLPFCQLSFWFGDEWRSTIQPGTRQNANRLITLSRFLRRRS